jgi:hypothetical protein
MTGKYAIALPSGAALVHVVGSTMNRAARRPRSVAQTPVFDNNYSAFTFGLNEFLGSRESYTLVL